MKTVAKYWLITAVIIIYWEIIMSVQLGGPNTSSLFLLFFIPSQSLIVTALCGIGGTKCAKITFPIILLPLCIYYIVQTVYLHNFGSLFSISMAGMGADAINDFWWALTDALADSAISIALIVLPIVILIVLLCIKVGRGEIEGSRDEQEAPRDEQKGSRDVLKLTGYKWWLHFVCIVAGVILWMAAVGGIRLFGTGRTSPYYLYTSNSSTTDATASKLGTLTTAVVEAGSYYFGIGADRDNEFIYDDLNDSLYAGDSESGSALSSGILHIPVYPVEDYLASIGAYSDADTKQAEEEKFVPSPRINEAIDFNKIASVTDSEKVKSLAGYYARQSGSTTNEYTGMFEGYNLIYICAEGFWSYACNEKVTPTLYMMANNGIVLNNYYNSFYNTTTNGEFAFITGQWPDVSRHSSAGTDVGSFAQSASKFMPQGMGRLFEDQGIPSYGFHNFIGKYYRRNLSWPNLGYKCKFSGEGMHFTSNWPASDLELMEQSVDDYINEERFNVYYMTFSGHGPYTDSNYMFNKNIRDVNAIIGEDTLDSEARGYLAGNLELDRAMEYLLERLEDAGRLDNTVIVIAGDHYPYYLSDEGRDSLAGHKMDEKFEIYHSSCIMYNSGMAEPMQVDDFCCNIDIAPTILNLMNIPFDSRLMAGRDIFSNEAHNRAVLYNKSFVTELVKYDYETGDAVWNGAGENMSDEDKEDYLDRQLNSIENEYNASCRLVDENFMLDVYHMSGLLDDAQASEELAREQKVRDRDAVLNAEDAAEEAAKEAEKAAEEAAELMQQMMQQQQPEQMQQMLQMQ